VKRLAEFATHELRQVEHNVLSQLHVPIRGTDSMSAPTMTDRPSALDTAATPAPETPKRGGKGTLLIHKKPKTRWVTLDDGSEQLISSLRPREIAEINRFCLIETPVDSAKPDGEMKYEWDIMRPFYLIARSLCEPDGKRMYKSTIGADTAWQAGGSEIADMVEYADVQTLLDAVQDISGLSKKAKAAVGKDSGGTRNEGS